LAVRPAKVLFALHSTENRTIVRIKPKAHAMKQFAFILVALIMLSACAAPKPYYETKEGKRKQKYYNDIQYGRNAHPKMKF
jgi:hypothetical protein